MHAPDIIGSQTGGHRLNALPLAWQQKGGAVVFHRDIPVSMPCGFRQALDICRKTSFLWAWRDLFAHRTILYQIDSAAPRIFARSNSGNEMLFRQIVPSAI